MPATDPPDPHSHARPDQVRVTHMDLDWDVDFDAAALRGTASLWLAREDARAPLILDTRGLTIEAVEVGAGGAPDLSGSFDDAARSLAWREASFELGASEPVLGRALTIALPGDATRVRVRYATTQDATGLQWLEPAQTAGKRHPFLFSQSQAIHARTWIPCQDSPGARVTYTARVRAPAPHVAVMSADMVDGTQPSAADGARAFRFAMSQPVPAYLIALAVGELGRAELGPRTAVWADPAALAAAADEFADMERMLELAEGLYGPYAWGRYDVLVLPPAFPFGGMENPRLTFATPTIIAGDRSLNSLIAHELAHSWSGNLVTNATWEDLWLNEGFTVYFERRIVEASYGPARAAMEAMLGLQELEAELAGELAARPDDQRLRVTLAGRDPDETFSSIAYEKGALLLTALERAYGRETFDAFLRGWFDRHRFGAVTTADFEAYARRELLEPREALPGARVPSLREWIHGPGLPADAPRASSPAFADVDRELAAFLAGTTSARALNTSGWVTQQWQHLLRALPESVTPAQLASLDEAYALTQTRNAEIACEWLTIAARVRYAPALPRLERFLIEVGRRKFLMPLYGALLTTPEGRAQALEIYARARPGYHAISRASVDALLADAGLRVEG
ncbi:MAG: M1 family metallopeptidase [Myxococcales bacterium]|nr:M1 family metallopeptidase [Myxococcales bacterium]